MVFKPAQDDLTLRAEETACSYPTSLFVGSLKILSFSA